MSQKALKALIIFFFVLAAYLAIRFEWKMSAAAIVAVIHDIIFTIGVYALFHFQVSPATVTAFLTILGFLALRHRRRVRQGRRVPKAP